jgi:hypothetical protein
MDKVTITKVDDSPSSTSTPAPHKPAGAARSKRKTQKTFPRGILKVKPVADPAKAPPLKKTAKRETIQILTEKGAKKRRKTIRRLVAGYSNDQVKSLVEKHGLLKNKHTPPALMRDMLEGGAIAGFISLD